VEPSSDLFSLFQDGSVDVEKTEKKKKKRKKEKEEKSKSKLNTYNGFVKVHFCPFVPR